MSEPKKYVTFRDLKDLKKEVNNSEKTDTSTSTSSIASISSTSDKKRQKKEITNKLSFDSVAPERDFQKVPNSVTRHALQEGLFRGKSKQVWDYLWSVSRGAVVPSRYVRKSRRQIKAGSGLGSMVTVDAAIEHLINIKLLFVRPAIGSFSGNEYEVFTPEEAAGSDRYTSRASISSYTSLTHKVDVLDIPESSTSSTPLSALDSIDSGESNTSFNTTHDDDTHTLLNYFAETLLNAAQEIVGGRIAVTEQERVLWNECACVLVEELKRAAKQTQTISSVPAFLAAHLRRQFTKGTRVNGKDRAEDLVSNSRASYPIPSRKATVVTPLPRDESANNRSKFSLEECRRYADHLKTTGQGITNPGGYATTIYRTGEADALIEKFLSPDSDVTLDITKCIDCKGTGFIYPEGIERGVVAKCKHPRLPTFLKFNEQVERLRQVHFGDTSYQTQELIEDLKFICEREELAWDQEVVDYLLGQAV